MSAIESARNLKAALINLHATKGFVKRRRLVVAGHGQDNQIVPAFRKPEPGRGGNEAAADPPAMIVP